MNFARDILSGQPRERLALVELTRDGSRREWTFGEVERAGDGMAGELLARGVRKGDVVMTLIGNRSEWVLTMMACFRIGAVVLPCTEQLRAKDLRLRLEVARPSLIVADRRNREQIEAAEPDCRVLYVPDESLLQAEGMPLAEVAEDDPALITFTSGTAGEPKAVVHGQRYLYGQRVQAERVAGRRSGRPRVVHGGKRVEQVGAQRMDRAMADGRTALLHDARFDPHERLDLIERERVNVLCMAPTEYRVIAKRATTAGAAEPEGHGGRGRGAQPRGAEGVEGGHRPGHQGRLRSDRDRSDDGHESWDSCSCRVDGKRAAGSPVERHRRRAGRRSAEACRRSSWGTWARV